MAGLTKAQKAEKPGNGPNPPADTGAVDLTKLESPHSKRSILS